MRHWFKALGYLAAICIFVVSANAIFRALFMKVNHDTLENGVYGMGFAIAVAIFTKVLAKGIH